ncbi:hypothetical protein Micbo1qcDRAFT_198013 [Microdochium bolleyi]|uniref:Uncharacterized protein n=1 Tax=Microdochium bolleyi TaxID=196109 RepID=A0A136IPF6_9PEZI|nr:hypothetical protein Micbo1qcDRAFT_198013 [Microdochium bolleyi]
MATASTTAAAGRYSAVWRKRDNLSAWILQGLSSIILLAFAIWRTVKYSQSFANGRWVTAHDFIFVVCFTGATLLLNTAEVVLFTRGSLHPVFLLVSAVVKTIIWGLLFCINLAQLIRTYLYSDPVMLVTGLVLFSTAISQLVISAMAVHRMRKGTLLLTARGGRSDEEEEKPPKYDV